MELKDLVIRKRYRVIPHTTFEIIEDVFGNYEATSAENVRKALTDKVPPDDVMVNTGNTWHPISRSLKYRKK